MNKSVEETKKEIDSFNEMNVYFVINEIGGFIWRMNHDFSDGRISVDEMINIQKDIERMTEIQHYAVSILPKFGVNEPYRNIESKKPSSQYWAWFRWWDSYIKNLSNEEWNVLNRKISNKEDVSNYKPSGDWRDSIEKEEESIKKAEEFWKGLKSE